jgi:hypothetical protein
MYWLFFGLNGYSAYPQMFEHAIKGKIMQYSINDPLICTFIHTTDTQ